MVETEEEEISAKTEHYRISSHASKEITAETNTHEKNAYNLQEEFNSLKNELKSLRRNHFEEEKYLRKVWKDSHKTVQ